MKKIQMVLIKHRLRWNMQGRQQKKLNLFFNHTVGMSCNDLQFIRKYNLLINIYYSNCLND